MIQTTIDKVQEVFIKKGYTWLDDGYSYKLNIIGVRNQNKESNQFNDTLIVVYRDEKFKPQIKIYPFTTDPGKYWLNNPMNKKGTAIVVEGQYIDLWKLGKHKGYKALQQINNIKVYRDNNKDSKLDYNNIDIGLFGINLHRSNPYTESTLVNKWSAGCQVFKNKNNYDEFIELCEISNTLYNCNFNYTLINESDL